MSTGAVARGSRTLRVGGDFAAMTGGWLVRAVLGVVVSVLTAR